MTEQTNKTRSLRVRWYDLILVLAAVSLAAGWLPDALYLDLLTRIRIELDAERAAQMLGQLRIFAPTLAVVALALWWAIGEAAPDIRARLRFKSKTATLLVRLHFLILVPTLAYWFFYGIYWLIVPEAEWKEEARVVPWHRDVSDAAARLKRRIPEDDSVLLILEGRGTMSYAGYFNAYLYPRKVYLHRRRLDRERIARADVNVAEIKEAGIDWIIIYSGPREFDADQLKVERVP